MRIIDLMIIGLSVFAAVGSSARITPPSDEATPVAHVVVGTVLGSQTEWFEHRRILTRYHVELEAALGEDMIIDVVLPGGERDGYVQRVGGVPNLVIGQRALLYLKHKNTTLDAYTLADWHQSYFPLAPSEERTDPLSILKVGE